MKLAIVGWVLGVVWLGLAGVLAIPLVIAVVLGEPWMPFALAAAAALGGGALLFFALRSAERNLGHRQAFLIVTLVWCSVCALGAIPYATYPEPRLAPIDALFEAVAGFTTTGATVLSGLDALPASLLIWRSTTQWLGGMGMVILGVAVLPLLGVGGMQLYKAEAPGPSKDKMTPRITETAKLLWMVYLGITVAVGVVFYLSGMTAFDALNHAMTSVATGGFSTHDQSLGYYDSAWIHTTATVAMLTGGTSFAILHRLLTGHVDWSVQPELRAYLGIVLVATLVIAADLTLNMPERFFGLAGALEHASFQVVSIVTTTGYSTDDFDRWPGLSHAVLLSLFFIGGMAGSTSGGLKVVRVVLLARAASMQFRKLLHRHSVDLVRLGPRSVEPHVLTASLSLISIWLILLVAGTLALAAGGSDLVSSLTGAAASLGNVGPGFGVIGPAHTFAPLDAWSKAVMQVLMILGRLEVYTVLVILTPGFWRF